MKECGNRPGFSKSFVDPNSERISYKEFLKVSFKWQSRMAKVNIKNYNIFY